MKNMTPKSRKETPINTTKLKVTENFQLDQVEFVPLLNIQKTSSTGDLGDGRSWSKPKVIPRSVSSEAFNLEKEEIIIPWDVLSSTITFSYDVGVETNLTKAVAEGDLKALKDIFDNISPRSKEAENSLLLACRKGHTEIVKFLLDAGVNVHSTDSKSGLDAISVATYYDHGEVIEALANEEAMKCLPRIEFNGVRVSLLHFASFFGCISAFKAFFNCSKFNANVDELDRDHWKPLHYACSQSRLEIVRFLLENNANPNADGPYNIRPLHVASYKGDVPIVELLLEYKADPRKIVSLNPPLYLFTYEHFELNRRKTKSIPAVVTYNTKTFSSLLHWAVVKAPVSLVEKMLAQGCSVDIPDLEGRTPLGLALTEFRTDIVMCLKERGIRLSSEDKNWRRILDEESGINVLQILESTNLDTLDCSNNEGFSLLHLAASKGYLSLLNRLLTRGVNPDSETDRGETPLFFAIENNHHACVLQLIHRNCNVCHISKRKASVLHSAAKYNNFAAIDIILNMISKGKVLDINLADEQGFTALYYAINASRYDIVQRFVQFCVSESIHVKATNNETLLQFYTERNILGQYDNAIVRVLEMEKELHNSKFTAEKCLRMQLGTTEASTKARDQLQAMYESTQCQLHCWNFWIVISCFFMPSILYYLDVYTDVILAFEYYNDYIRTQNKTDKIAVVIFDLEKIEDQSKINLLLTVFFILFPMALLSIWSLYVHLTQQDVLPPIGRMPVFQRFLLYIILFIPPLGPIISYIENSYAQIKYMNVTSEISQKKFDSPSVMSLDDEEKGTSRSSSNKLQEHYNLKHVAQMRVAINNVLEATLESAFQLILQLYILGTQYNELKNLQLGNLTLGSILSLTPTEDSQSRLSKQVLSVIISLMSLTWSFTAYHRFSKLGGLRILWSLPLLFAIFFQIISRAIACTVFTLAYTWRMFIVLGVHYMLVLFLKAAFEKRTEAPESAIFHCNPCFSCLRPYFYVILGAFTSTFVYFRIQRPLADKDQLSQRYSSFLIQILFLCLALLENVMLFGFGVSNLNPTEYDNVFKIVAGVLCLISFIIGVILQWVYYGCFGHPWVNINGPSIERDDNGTLLVSFYKEGGQIQWVIESCGNCKSHFEEQKDNVYIPRDLSRKRTMSNGGKIPR